MQAWATTSGFCATFRHFSQVLQQLSPLSPTLFHLFVYFGEGVFETGFLCVALAVLELDL